MYNNHVMMNTKLMKRNAKRGCKGIGKVQISLDKVKPSNVTLITGLNISLSDWIQKHNLKK